MPREADRHLAALARRRGGVFTWREAQALRVPVSTLYDRARRGAYLRLQPGVYSIAGAPDGLQVRYHAAVLGAGDGALLSHASAADLWGLIRRPSADRIHVLTSGRQRFPDGVLVHRTRYLPDHHRSRYRGIPVTSVERTLCDLSSQVDLVGLRSAMASAVRGGCVTSDDVARCLDEMGRLRGARQLRAVISELSPHEARAKSELESLFVRMTTRAGLPPPELNHPVLDADGRRRLIDAAYVDHGLAVELDGRRWHGLTTDRDEDVVRQNALVLAGWRWFLRFTWRDLTCDPQRVVRQVRGMLAVAEAEA